MNFSSVSKVRLFTADGIEIIDDTDVKFYVCKPSESNGLFFTNDNQNFDHRFLLEISSVKRKLGEGPFGKVLLVKNNLTYQTKVIKIFKYGPST